jgi:phage baseplate assembly protein W
MTEQRYRAWRFVHPDLDMGPEESGLQVTAQSQIGMVEGSDSIRQAILLLLTTIPGERLMRPDYGCDLHRLVFAPNDPTTAGLAIHYVRRALERWEPRVEVLQLDADPDHLGAERLRITLTYRIRATGRREEMTLSMNLLGEEV